MPTTPSQPVLPSAGITDENAPIDGLLPAQGAIPSPLTTGCIAEPELGGRGGLDPTRFGDWEKNGRCIDF
jgi:hypothetical protein